jgi:hypothetical protein
LFTRKDMDVMKRTSWMIYECLALVIVLITGIDVWWSIALADTLYQNELNPIACWVLAAGQPESSVSSYAGVAWLCALKCVSTWVVLSICRHLVRRRPSVGWSVLFGVTAFQLWLVWFIFHAP